MQRSESIAKLAEALSAAQGAIENAAKDADNPFFKSKYADLASIRDAVRTAFAANGLSCPQFVTTKLTDLTEQREDKDGKPFVAYLTLVSVETMLLHSSGEFMSSVLDLPIWDADPQKVGSASTYGRRYGLQSVAGVAAELDDDGNAASGKQYQVKQEQRPAARREPPSPAKPVGTPASQAKAAEAVRGPANGNAYQTPPGRDFRTQDAPKPAPGAAKPASQPPAAPSERLTGATKTRMSDLARSLRLGREDALAKTQAIVGKPWGEMSEADGLMVCVAFEAEFQKALNAEAGA